MSDFEQGEIGPDLFRHACLLGLEGLVSIGETVFAGINVWMPILVKLLPHMVRLCTAFVAIVFGHCIVPHRGLHIKALHREIDQLCRTGSDRAIQSAPAGTSVPRVGMQDLNAFLGMTG
jgi:hypothetical protein